jgi:hypothetical protein
MSSLMDVIVEVAPPESLRSDRASRGVDRLCRDRGCPCLSGTGISRRCSASGEEFDGNSSADRDRAFSQYRDAMRQMEQGLADPDGWPGRLVQALTCRQGTGLRARPYTHAV